MMTERCELLVKTKSLAKKRGLEPSLVNCPATQSCDGRYCIFLSDPLDLENRPIGQIEKFEKRLEKYQEIIKK